MNGINKITWTAIIVSIIGFLSIIIFGKESFLPVIFVIPAIVLFIIAFIKHQKESLRQLEIEQAKASATRASKELDTLKRLFDQEMISEQEYELKKESVRKKYASYISKYVEE
ncbi:hypothetical protein [Paenibacillus wynnii]|uniref:hypothetical protein n=1 Tax=Paenibacillus wynnii TaxID=268407 RepID=UPI002792EEF4|nr:hypothetical protein [Paenibacillus wynnii]MDQ0193082.1 multidrug resistance efflux pump [Paenibacillus wynnii]